MPSPAKPESQPSLLRPAIDIALAVGLSIALLVVILVDRFQTTTPAPPPSHEVSPGGLAHDEPAPIRRLRLGVTPKVPEFDDMAKLLDTLGEGYQYEMFPLNDLRYPEKLKRYDVVFLTCSGVTREWVDRAVGSGVRGMTAVLLKQDVMEEVYKGLREYVGKGGTLYASDFHFNLVAKAFSDYVDNDGIGKGKVQSLTAKVVDPGLRELIGSDLSLSFDQPGWRPAAFAADKVTVYLRAPYRSEDDEGKDSPLLVKFRYQDGTVIFTSFHNEKQNSEIEAKLLRFLVFAAVTAKVETRIDKQMVQLGFNPAKKGLFSTSKSEPTITQTYHCPRQTHLQFVLGFPEQGARLKLNVKGPDGKTYQQEGTSTITIDVPAAQPGQWEYTIEALHLPNDNFPFTVTVGEK